MLNKFECEINFNKTEELRGLHMRTRPKYFEGQNNFTRIIATIIRIMIQKNFAKNPNKILDNFRNRDQPIV